MTGAGTYSCFFLGFAGASFGALVALDVGTSRKHKPDCRSRSIACGDVACTVKALMEWLNAAGIVSGSLFRPINKSGIVAASRLTDRSVANIVKEYAGRAGFDAAIFSAHSLRSGFLTSAAAKGASIFKMVDQSGH